MNRKLLSISFILFLIIAIPFSVLAAEDADLLIVHFINVGQADCIFIELPSNQNLLIDGGNNDDGELVVKYLKEKGVERLDHVIGTHPHEDHIGGLDVVILNFDIGKVYLPRVVHTTRTYQDLLIAIKNKGLKITEAKSGVKIDAGKDIEAIFLAPNSSNYKSLNNYSAVLKITYKDTSFLFLGDAEAESEEEMLSRGNLKADIIKVGHHGSKSSTTQIFLDEVSPLYAVISVGSDNSYGHPHKETVTKFIDSEVEIYRTDIHGTIIISSDGKKEDISVAKKNSPDIRIIAIDRIGEKVVIKNFGHEIDISGWQLISEVGNQVFIFPSGTILPPGETITVVSGSKAKAGPGLLVWTNNYIWNNSGDPGALYDINGMLISRYE